MNPLRPSGFNEGIYESINQWTRWFIANYVYMLVGLPNQLEQYTLGKDDGALRRIFPLFVSRAEEIIEMGNETN